MKVESLYNLLAPIYGRVVPQFVERTTRRAVQRVAAGHPANLLEVGVGPGTALVQLARKTGAKTVAIDLSRKMLTIARNKAENADTGTTLAQADVLSLPFSDGRFDAVLSTFVLDLIRKRDIETAFREIVRVVTPGGRIVLASVDITSAPLRSVWNLAHSIVPDIVGFVRPVDISELYDKVGLRTLRDELINESVGTRVTTLVKVVA